MSRGSNTRALTARQKGRVLRSELVHAAGCVLSSPGEVCAAVDVYRENPDPEVLSEELLRELLVVRVPRSLRKLRRILTVLSQCDGKTYAIVDSSSRILTVFSSCDGKKNPPR